MLVAFGHFIGTVKYASEISVNTGWIDFLNRFRLGFLINESFYLYLFFVVSGFLIAHSKVKDIKDLAVRFVSRFLRLALPILGACILILLFSKIVPFYSDDTVSIFENSWLQSAYSERLTVWDAFLSPIHVLIFGKVAFNSPYWVLSSMMFGSLVIYLLSYIKSKLSSDILRLIVDLAFVAAAFFLDKIIFACLIGSLIFCYEEKIYSLLKSKLLLCLLGIPAFAVCLLHMVYGAILFFGWMIIAIPRLTYVKRVLEIMPLRFLGNISFGIYSFHWPIFCSVGCLVMMKLWSGGGDGFAVLIAILVTIALTLAISVAYNYLVEITSNKAVDFVRKKMYAMLTKKKEDN